MNKDWTHRKELIGAEIEVREDGAIFRGSVSTLTAVGSTGFVVNIIEVKKFINDTGPGENFSDLALPVYYADCTNIQTPSDGRVIIWRDRGGITIRPRK